MYLTLNLIDGIEPIAKIGCPKIKKFLSFVPKKVLHKWSLKCLIEAGFEASYLEGGMKSWSEHLEKVKVHEDDKISVYQFIRVGKGCLSYMVVSEDEALLVDPARFVEEYEREAGKQLVQKLHILSIHICMQTIFQVEKN